jgi:hypothetical protein
MGRECSSRGEGEKINAYMISVGKSEEKSPLGKPRRWQEDSIKILSP